jgi:hypothetical protein
MYVYVSHCGHVAFCHILPPTCSLLRLHMAVMCKNQWGLSISTKQFHNLTFGEFEASECQWTVENAFSKHVSAENNVYTESQQIVLS